LDRGTLGALAPLLIWNINQNLTLISILILRIKFKISQDEESWRRVRLGIGERL
jgi:hypothetical protein